MDFLKNFVYTKKLNTKELLILNDASPLDDCGNRFNWIYIIAVIASVLSLVCVFISGENIIFGIIVFGLMIWGGSWGIKMKLCRSSKYKFREAKFAIRKKYSLVELMAMISPTLKKEGLTLELDNESIVIASNRTRFMVSYIEDQNGFTVYWYKTLARAFFSFDDIILYREISETTALIAYVIQCVTGTNNNGTEYQNPNAMQNNIIINSETASVMRENVNYKSVSENSDYLECPSCHKKVHIKSKFCKYCGKSV